MLSGDEVRPGAHPPSGFSARFVNFDRNNDGVISRTEWRENLKMFDRLDANHDGLLSPAELARR